MDDPEIAAALVRALHEVAAELDVVIPVHPRGRAALEAAGLSSHPGIHACPPLGYLEFMAPGPRRGRGGYRLRRGAGGDHAAARAVPDPAAEHRAAHHHHQRQQPAGHAAELASAVLKACDDGPYTGELPPLWDGHAGLRIARIITAWLARDG